MDVVLLEGRTFLMDDYAAWIGRTDQCADVVSVTQTRALLATLDRDPNSISPGEPLPPLFHWLYCHELARQAELDVDGHKKKGEFLPPLPFPRRMWAGGRLRFEGQLKIGDPIERVSKLLTIMPKEGRSGPLVLVTVEHRITAGHGQVVEEQDLVYLDRPTAPLALPTQPAPETQVDWSDTITPDVATLFRFSALTFNAHRIHYDRDYARDVEQYPDVVVHGPLAALLLADLAERSSGRSLVAFAFRARRPMFVDRPVTLEGGAGETSALLRALDDTGAVAMTAEASFSERRA